MNNSTDNDFGLRLKSERSRLKLTQEELAIKAGVKPLTVFQYEKGNSSPTMKFLYKLKEIGFNLDFMIYGENGSSNYGVNSVSTETLDKALELSEKIITSSFENSVLTDRQKLLLQLKLIDSLSQKSSNNAVKLEDVFNFISILKGGVNYE